MRRCSATERTPKWKFSFCSLREMAKLVCHLNFKIVAKLLPLVLCALEEDDPSLTQRKSWQDVAVTLAAARGAWGPLIYTALKT